MKYDYIIIGRWRNREVIKEVLTQLRDAGKKVYCFIDNSYDSDGVLIDTSNEADVEAFMSDLEKLEDWQTNPTFREIFEKDMNGIRESKEVILVFPAGASAHMELGAAYGMGKKCYAIGKPEKHETLYLMLENIYEDTGAFLEEHVGVKA